MNQSQIVFLIVGWACAAGAADVASGQFVQHSGQYIELTTDVATTAEAESLVASFDAAVPQWIEFWDLPAESVADLLFEAEFWVANASQKSGRCSHQTPFSAGTANSSPRNGTTATGSKSRRGGLP